MLENRTQRLLIWNTKLSFLHCILTGDEFCMSAEYKKDSANTNTKTRTLSTEVLVLYLMEYGWCRLLQAIGTCKELHSRCLLLVFWSGKLGRTSKVSWIGTLCIDIKSIFSSMNYILLTSKFDFQIVLCNTNNLYTVIWFYVFLPITTNFQAKLFDSKLGP